MFHRDLAKATPASDEVFRAYRAMYAYDKTPVHATVQTVADPSPDWTREKITVDAAYAGQPLIVYLFVPKQAPRPLQAVVFFPSARVGSLTSSDQLGDLTFVDYVIKSGRAVAYPIYLGFYERGRKAPVNPGPTLQRDVTTSWARDVSRTIDYLESRPDIDANRIGYLGASQGAAWGVLFTALEDRLKAVVLLDGGFFQWPNPPSGLDQVDFAPRITKPVLMINGRYDAAFPVESSQDPLFRMIGTPAADKRHVYFDTPHDVRQRRPDLIREVLGWFDTYLGRVS
jgi:dienelactone hydrolase